MLHPGTLKWAKHLKFFIPTLFQKNLRRWEIQLLIGDLFKFPSIFCVMLSCFVHQNFKSNISTASQALWPGHSVHITSWVQKEIWRPFSTWELSGEFSVGIWVPEATKRKLFNLQNKTTKRFVWTWAKTGVVFWKMRKPVEIGFSFTYFSLMLKNTFKSYGWKCEWIEVFFRNAAVQCLNSVWLFKGWFLKSVDYFDQEFYPKTWTY